MSDTEGLQDAIEDCSVDLVGTRFASPTVVNGRVTAKAIESTFDFRGSIQPLSGRELKQLPEGSRDQNRKKLYTATELFTVRSSASKLPDHVTYKGETFIVDKVADWDDLGGYFRVELVELGQ